MSSNVIGQMTKEITNPQFFRELWSEIQKDNVFNGAAALAFYWILAVFPGMIFLLSLLPLIPIPNLEQAIMDLLKQALPQEAASLFTGVVRDVVSSSSGGLLSFGLLLALWSASSGMYAVMQQLNITCNVADGRSFARVRAVALLLVVIFLVLIIGAFGLIVFGGVLEDWIGSMIGYSGALLAFFAVFRWVVIVCLILLAFAVIYYLGPDVEQKFQFVTPGSVIGAALLVVFSLVFSYYVSNFGDYSATYGSLGAVIILLLWLYLAGLVILLGSEANALVEHHSSEGKEKGEKVDE